MSTTFAKLLEGLYGLEVRGVTNSVPRRFDVHEVLKQIFEKGIPDRAGFVTSWKELDFSKTDEGVFEIVTIQARRNL